MDNDILKIESKHITTRVRPPRVVTLININDKDWLHTCDRIIERYSQLWGGFYNFIIPTDGKEIDDVFWQLMEIYDADYIVRYIKTFKDIELSDPVKFDQIKSHYVEDWLKRYPEEDPANAKKMIDNMFEREHSEIEKFEISSELKAELIKRLNPFHYDIETGIGYSRADEGAAHNKASVMPVYNELKDCKIKDYDVSALIKPLQLYVRSYVGNSRALIKNLQVQERPFEIQKTNPNVDLSTQVIDDSTLSEINSKIKNERQNINLSPYWYTHFGLARYTKIPRTFDKNAIVIVGDDIKDFCLFHNLSKIQDEIYWLPKLVIDQIKENQHFKWFVSSQILSIRSGLRESSNKEAEVAITSHSLSAQQLEELTLIINEAESVRFSDDRNLNWIVESPSNLRKRIKSPYVIYEFGNANNSYLEQFINKKSVNLLKTPKPTTFKELDIFGSKWISEFDIRSDALEDKLSGYQLPKKSCFSTKIFEGARGSVHDTSTIRFSKDCISFYCPTMGFISAGNTIDEIIVRPRILLLDEVEIFEILFKDIGYKVKLSDKGRYTLATINLFGSLIKLSEELKSEAVVKMLNSFVDDRSGQKRLDDKIPGCNLNKRSYLKFEDLTEIFSDKKIAREKIDEYLQKRILLRGVVLQCENCREVDWYDVEELGQSFVCRRCYEKQIYIEKHWKGNGEELPFYYKLNEMVYQGFKNNMIVPVLAISKLSKLTDKSFIFLPEIELIKIDAQKQTSPEIEVDTACIIDGRIYLGEAKIKSEIPAKLSLLNEITEKLSAHFVYSTMDDKISTSVEGAISALNWKKEIIKQTRETLTS